MAEWRNEVYQKYPVVKVEEMKRIKEDLIIAKKLLERAACTTNYGWKKEFAEVVEKAFRLLVSLNLETGE